MVYFSTFRTLSRGKKILLATGSLLTAGTAGIVYALENSMKAQELLLHPPKFKWSHNGTFSSFDVHSLRRGYQVYKEVCAACHSMRFVAYRHMVGVLMTEEEAKAEAAEITVTDGPDEKGNMFERPGKLADYMPSPYPNEEAAMFANSGANPPDLSYIVLARHGEEDYVFSLLTGYCEAPAGVSVAEGQSYNPYFPGGVIGMPQGLYTGLIEYNDGTPASASQMAKDVTCFLRWTAEPYHDKRKKLAIQLMIFWSIVLPIGFYYYRHAWSSKFARKITFQPKRH